MVAPSYDDGIAGWQEGTGNVTDMSVTLPSSMRVPVFQGQGTINWIDKAVPEPGAGQLLVAVAANALCGTDRLQHRFGSPVTPGHEISGCPRMDRTSADELV